MRSALDRFGVDPRAGGASTRAPRREGSPTSCCRRGAAHVIAIDVGYGQLAWVLRNDERVTALRADERPRRHRRHLPFAPSLVVADLSFISLAIGGSDARRPRAGRATFVVLVKPQFEAGPEGVGRGGVVRDPATWREAILAVADAFTRLGGRPARRSRVAAAWPRRQRGVPPPRRLGGRRTPDRRGRRRSAPGRHEARRMTRVGLVVHEGRAAAVEAAAGPARRASRSTGSRSSTRPAPPRGSRLVVSVGGDGTFLRGAHVASHADAPVLGVKVGRVGFLTEVEPPDALDLREGSRRGQGRRRGTLGGDRGARAHRHVRAAVRAAVGHERDHGREAGTSPAGEAGRRGRRRLRDDVLGGRRDRGDADRVDRLFVLRAGPDRRPVGSVPRADTDRGAHGVRPFVRPGR